MAQPLYRDLVLRDGARNYWRLGEASGTTAVDVVGGVNGTISGGVTLGQAGALGDGDKAMVFNGTTGKISPAAGTVPLPFTWECWLKTGVAGIEQIALSGTVPPWPSGVDGLNLTVASNGVYVYVHNGVAAAGSSSTGPSVTDNQWHHIVVICRPNDLTIYQDGVMRVSGPLSGLTVVGPTPIPAIGNSPAGPGFFPGSIDEVAIYPLALSPAQILAHYNARTLPYVPGTYPARVIASGPSNYWRLGEASGLTAVDLVGGANGTISGGVTLGQKGALSEPDTAVTFNGTDGKIVTVSPITIPVTATIEAWVKTLPGAGLSQNPIVSLTGQAPIFYTGGSIAFFDPPVGAISGTAGGDDGNWHHVAVVLTGTVGTMYVDGVLNITQAYVRPAAETAVAGIGYNDTYPPGNAHGFFEGTLDEVAIYPRALPLSELVAHYQAKLADMWDPRLYPPTSPPTTGPVAYPAVTSPYPQPPGTPEYAPRPAPTLASLTPSSVAVVAGTPSFQVVTLTGTNFSNASRISLAGVLDQFRVDETITYRDPTSLQITLDVRGLVAGAYQLGVVNQDSQASTTLPFTVS